MPIDFEADTDPLQPSDEAAQDYYSKIGPSEAQKLGAEAMSGPTALLGGAVARGSYADASTFDRMAFAASNADLGPGDEGGLNRQFGTDETTKEPLLPAEEINKRYGVPGPDGKMQPITDRPMGEGLASLIAKQKQDEIARDAVLARYQSQHGLIRNFASGTAGFLLDPLNLGSMFVPGIGEEAILSNAARVGLGTGLATRTAARFGAGLTTGAAQMGSLAAGRYMLEQEQASDYDLRAAFKDMAFGAAFGAVAHAGFGGLREAGLLGADHLMDPGLRAGLEMNRAIDGVSQGDVDAVLNASLAQRETAMKAGVSQIIDGRQVDVSPVIPALGEIADFSSRIDTASVDELASHPAMRAAEKRMSAIEPTDQQPGYGTPEWDRNRSFDFDGEKVVGYEQALPRFIQRAEDYAGPQGVQKDGHAFIVIGPPAAGKSTLAERIAQAGHAAIVDADDVKKVLPEYDGGVGANAVHEESARIAEGPVYEHFIRSQSNIVLPKVGANYASISRRVNDLKVLGYKVHLINLNVSPDRAFRRMVRRFTTTGRLIPSDYFSSIGDGPSRTYMSLRGDNRLDSHAEVDGNGPLGAPIKLNDGTGRAAEAALGKPLAEGSGRGGGSTRVIDDAEDPSRARGGQEASGQNLTAAEFAERQAQIYRDGFAPGVPQSEFEATTDRLYGSRAEEPTATPEPKPTVDPRTGTTRDPEMEALEQRVVTSPHLTDADRAEIADVNNKVSVAAARADAYTLAADMLARGERLLPANRALMNDGQEVSVSGALRRAVGKVMPDAPDDFVLASMRKIEDRDDWLGDMMRDLVAKAEEEPAPPRMEQSLEGALREIIAAATPAERGEATLDYEMRKLISKVPEPAVKLARHQVFKPGDVTIGDAPADPYYASDGYSFERSGETLYHSMSFVKNGDAIDAVIHDIHDGDGNDPDTPLSRVEQHKLKKEARGYVEDEAEEETAGARWDSLAPAEQKAEIEAQERERQSADRAKADLINSKVDALVASGWRPEVNRLGGWRRPDVLQEFASPKSVDMIDARLLHHGIDIEAAKQRARDIDGAVQASMRRSPEALAAASDRAAQDVTVMARRGDAELAARTQAEPASREGQGAEAQPDLTLRNNRTGAEANAQSVTTLADMLDRYDVSKDETVDPLQRAAHMVIGSKLKEMIGDTPVFTVGPEQMRSLAEGRVKMQPGFEPAGFFDPGVKHIVSLDDALRDPQEASALALHEGSHAALMKVIDTSASASKVMEGLRQLALREHLAAGGAAADHYGLKNVHEFTSEASSNSKFQRFLASIPVGDDLARAMGLGEKTGNTLWDVFVAAVRKILGLAPDQHTMLDATLRGLHFLNEERAGMAREAGASGELQAAIRPGDPMSKIERSVADRGRLTPNEARTLIREVSDRAEQMRQTGESDPYVAAARELADKVKENARKDKLDALRNAESRANIMNRIDAAGGISAAPEQLRSMLHGTYQSGLASVQSQYRGLASTWMAALSHKLHSLGLEKAMISGAMDEDVAKELWAMNAGGGEGSGNKLARQAAEAIRPVLEEMKDRLNSLGARIGDATDYVATTRHDPYKMRRAAGMTRIRGKPLGDPDAAFATWWKDTQPLLSEKTFDGILPREGETEPQARDRFGRSVFDALLSGIHMKPDGVSGIRFDPEGGVQSGPAFEGTRNLAKKVSQERTLFWKDGAAWNSYVQKYGAQTSLAQGVMLSINQAAKQIALMERFGTNPMANLNQVERAIAERDRADIEGLKRFQGKMNGVRNVMAYLDGSANIPTNADWAALGNNVRTFYSVADLGGVGVTHFASIWPTVSSELRHHGVSRFDALRGMVGGLLQGKGPVERQEMLSDLGAYADGLSRDMMANWQPDSPRMGAMSSMANTFMKYTGIHYVFDNTQAAVRSMLSHNLARNMSKSFGDLDAHLQGMLSNYGINEREWDLLRSVDDLRIQDGRAYLTPHDAMRIDPGLIEAHLRETGELDSTIGKSDSDISGTNEPGPNPTDAATLKYAQSLSDKLGAYYSDVAAHSTVTAGARERAMLLGGTQAGSLSGEVMRFLTQFKMWPVAAYDQLLRREIQMSTGKLDLAWGLGSMVALSTASGYLRMTLNDWALGHPRRDLDAKTTFAALAQGGGLGILGDFMFGEVNRMGGGLIGTLGGPLVSDADELVKLFGRFRMDVTDPQSHHKTGTFGDLWPDLAHFGVRHIPFNNLVYLKGALDYLVWYHLFEAASPGWWDRTNRRLQKEQGRTMQGYTPGGGVPTGLPYLYMQNKTGQSFGLFGQR